MKIKLAAPRWAPTIVINEVITPISVALQMGCPGVIALLIRVVTLLITGRGPPCSAKAPSTCWICFSIRPPSFWEM